MGLTRCRKTSPKHHRPTWDWNLTCNPLWIKCFMWSSEHFTPCSIWIKSKAWYVGPHYTPPSVQWCVPNFTTWFQREHWPFAKFLHFRLQIYNVAHSNRLAWTFITGLQQFLTVFGAFLIHISWNFPHLYNSRLCTFRILIIPYCANVRLKVITSRWRNSSPLS